MLLDHLVVAFTPRFVWRAPKIGSDFPLSRREPLRTSLFALGQEHPFSCRKLPGFKFQQVFDHLANSLSDYGGKGLVSIYETEQLFFVLAR
jgi:hypothetical protein